MTREEAKRKIMDALFPPGSFAPFDYRPTAVALDAGILAEQHLKVAVALGTVTLDEPKTAVEQEACALLNAKIGCIGASVALNALKCAGFKIIKDNA